MLKQVLAIGFVTALLSGCASLPKAPETPSDFANKVQISNSKFDKDTKFTGYTITKHKVGLLPASTSYFLRSWKNKQTGRLKHQLYLSFNYFGDWRFYNSASFDDAKQISATEIDRDVVFCSSGYCNLKEDIGVSLSDKFLRSKMKQGFSIRINSKKASSEIINVSSHYIKGYLSVVK
mgnify:CR=1 FL=1